MEVKGRRNCASVRARRRRARSEGRWKELWERNIPLHDVSVAVPAAFPPLAGLHHGARRPGASTTECQDIMTRFHVHAVAGPCVGPAFPCFRPRPSC